MVQKLLDRYCRALKTYPRPEDCSWWKPFETGMAPVMRDDQLKLQMEYFGAVIRGETEPLVSVRDGLMNLRVTEAIALAAATGQTVDIRDLTRGSSIFLQKDFHENSHAPRHQPQHVRQARPGAVRHHHAR